MPPNQLRILFTNCILDRSGSALYVRNVALALRARGHSPIVYSQVHGEVALEIKRSGIPVVNNLAQIAVTPDIIHAHHHIESMTAMLWFPGVPAISFCHGPLPMQEAPPKFPSIVYYVAVSQASWERLVAENGIPEDKIRLVLNFVDLKRFKSRRSLPVAPRKALMFGNYLADHTGLRFVPVGRRPTRAPGVAVASRPRSARLPDAAVDLPAHRSSDRRPVRRALPRRPRLEDPAGARLEPATSCRQGPRAQRRGHPRLAAHDLAPR